MSCLYVVATPIGNLGDVSTRAVSVLKEVEAVAAEDTRHTGKLLKQLGISTRLLALHAHNEAASTDGILKLLGSGQSVALVSDAGTPLISDPGFLLVRQCHEKNIPVIPVPGPSALTAALSASGLPVNRFCFEGFLPSKSSARATALQALASEARTMVFYEAPHRIEATIEEMVRVFGQERQMTLCRELTKTYEQIVTAPARDLLSRLQTRSIPAKGEFVVVVSGSETGASYDDDRLLTALLSELSPSKAAALAARVTGQAGDSLYQRALVLKGRLES